jgi:arylsulfate sulfotransferase
MKLIYLLPLLLLLTACNSGPGDLEDVLAGKLVTKINPSGRVALGGLLTFMTQEPVTVEVTVPGETPVVRQFPDAALTHEIPVLGLYPGTDNEVSIKLTGKDGKEYQGTTVLTTKALPSIFPTIDITTMDRSAMESGFHIIDLLIGKQGKFLSYTVMFDDQGVIRWFMDLSENGQITYTPHRIKSGNWLYLNWIDLLEVDDLGRTVSEQQLYEFAGNHAVLEMPNGKLLMGGSAKDAYVLRNGEQVGTRFDHAVLWDREKNKPAMSWDMREVLDVSRAIFPPDYGMDPATDWFHVNSITMDPKDNNLLISGRNQGVVKVDLSNKLKWILGPHVGWKKTGFDQQGSETEPFLLTAIDANGQPYSQDIQEGRASAEDFDWPMGQHSVTVLPNGNVLLFDNGLRRHYEPGLSYSKAVEFKIDGKAKTIQQVWEYGKERGKEMSSPITSSVSVLPTTGNRLITSGNVRGSGKPGHAKMVEVTYPDNKVVFEADIYFKDALGTKEKSWGQFDLVFHGNRYSLLPQ